MHLKRAVWLFLLLGWSAPAAAQEVCAVNVTIEGNACSLSPLRAEGECTAYKYQVKTDRDVLLQTVPAGPSATPCAKAGCTVTSADAQTLALKVLNGSGAALDCTTGAAVRRPSAPAAKPATESSRSLAKALLAAELPDSHEAVSARSASPAGGRELARVQLQAQTEGQATGAQIVDDLFRTIAAVALERAESRAAQRLIDTATKALCGDDDTDPRRKTWQRTCGVLAQLSPATLGTAAEALRQAVAADVAQWIVDNAQLSSDKDRQYLAEVITQTLVPVLTRPGDVTRDDLLRVVNALVTHEWEGANADAVNLAFYVVRVCGKQTETDCDVGGVIEAAIPLICEKKPALCETMKSQRLRIEGVAAKLSLVIAQRGLKASELKRSLRDVVDVALSLAERLHADTTLTAEATAEPPAKVLKLQNARLLLLAMLADDTFSFASYVGDLVEGQKLSLKVHALLNAVLAYARTYKQDVPPGEDPAAKRKEIIETLVTASTERSQRTDDWIVSLGVDVGFDLAGYQWIDGAGTGFPPQLIMPLGLFVQRGPERCRPGFHAGAFVADVAQYASYQSDGTTNDPRWDTAIALGAQLGIIIGSIADPFVLGIDARYAPTLFSSAKSSEPASGGTVRLGIFASYYVSLFDLN